MPLRGGLAGNEDSPEVAERDEPIFQREDIAGLAKGDAYFSIADQRRVAGESVEVVSSQRVPDGSAAQVERRALRSAADESRFEEGVATPVLLAGHPQVEDDVGEHVAAQDRRG